MIIQKQRETSFSYCQMMMEHGLIIQSDSSSRNIETITFAVITPTHWNRLPGYKKH